MTMRTIEKKQLKATFLKEYNNLQKNNSFLKSSCILFVYNSTEKISRNDPHFSECVFADEIDLIRDAFNAFPSLSVNLIDSEELFIQKACYFKENYSQVYVYSMAQNIDGVGRRCLIPLICEFFGFINISSNSRSSFLGGDKNLMNDIIKNEIKQPNRLFITTINEREIEKFFSIHPLALLKPNSESASIGISKLEVRNREQMNNALIIIKNTLSIYGKVFLEEFITGKEVECTVIPWMYGNYIAEPVEIIKSSDFLDYNTVLNNQYGFKSYSATNASNIQSFARSAYELLKFDSIARFDFIVNGNSCYLFDITPNPTISQYSSANHAVKYIAKDARTIYQILFLNKCRSI